MVRRYKVKIREILQKVVEVEASSKEEAINTIKNSYKKEEIILYPEDLVEVLFS